MYFIKLAILIFGCPGNTHVTNFTRMPLSHHHLTSTWTKALFQGMSSLIHGALIHLDDLVEVYLTNENSNFFWLFMGFVQNTNFLFSGNNLEIFSPLLPDGAPLLRFVQVWPFFAFEVFGKLRKVGKGNIHPPRSGEVTSAALGGSYQV